VTKLLWPSPPGDGAVPPIGPGDPDWFPDINSEKVSSATAVSEKGIPNGRPGSHPDLVKTTSSVRVPIFGLKEKERGRTKSSVDEKANEAEFTEKPTVAVPVDQVVIRIEVRDTGTGIKKKDVRDAKLFSPYVQVSRPLLISV
jgi:hypothetical protein